MTSPPKSTSPSPGLLRAGTAVLTAAATLLAVAGGDPLAAERWRTRPLVVFAASADDALLVRLHDELARPATRASFDEREMVLWTVIGDTVHRGDAARPASDAPALRRALGVAPGGPSQAVLVGKDGGAKLRQSGRVDLATIFVTIDGMPMRRR